MHPHRKYGSQATELEMLSGPTIEIKESMMWFLSVNQGVFPLKKYISFFLKGKTKNPNQGVQTISNTLQGLLSF